MKAMEPDQEEREQLVDDSRNVMPSMVVRQQRQVQMGITSANPNNHHTNNHANQAAASGGHPAPTSAPSPTSTAGGQQEPIYVKSAALDAAGNWQHQEQQQQHLFDSDGLVLPRRLAHHKPGAQLMADQPIIRDLNRELKFNQIHGKNVLDQKSELKRAMERAAESRRKNEIAREKLNRRTSLELRLEERAAKIAKESTQTTSN